MGTAVHGGSGFDKDSRNGENTAGCRHELPYGWPPASLISLRGIPRLPHPLERLLSPWPFCPGGAPGWTQPPGWAGARGSSPLDLQVLLCRCVASVPGHGGSRRWDLKHLHLREGGREFKTPPGHYPRLAPGGAAGQAGKDGGRGGRVPGSEPGRRWTSRRASACPAAITAVMRECGAEASLSFQSPAGAHDLPPGATGNQGETGRARDGPHLAVEVRNQPQGNEAFRLAGLPRFVHKHVCEVSDSRAKGVVSGQPARVRPRARRASPGRRRPRRPVRTPNESLAAAGL